MKRMKTFFIYALIVLAVLLLTDSIIDICLNSMYKPTTENENQVQYLEEKQ